MFSPLMEMVYLVAIIAILLSSFFFSGSSHSTETQPAHPVQLSSEAVHAPSVDVSAAANALLDQAQVILGASSLYAAEHGGSYPERVRQLEEGRYLDSTVLPDPRVSSATYQLHDGRHGFEVALDLGNPAVCQQIAAWALRDSERNVQPGLKVEPHRDVPYDCAIRLGRATFTFRG